jgi:hypothetical protein
MPEELRDGETLVKLSKAEVQEIKELSYKIFNLNELIDRFAKERGGLLIMQHDFWNKIREKYLLKENVSYNVNFGTGDLIKLERNKL